MDIAAMSMGMSAAKVQAQATTSVMKMQMDTQSELAEKVITDLLPAAKTGHIDVSV